MDIAQRTVLGAVAVTAIVLNGCAGKIAGSSFVTWEKPGVTEEEMRAEFGLCGGSFDSFGTPRFKPSEFDRLNRCMSAKGFETVEM